MRINHNIASLNTYRQLSTNTANGAKSLEKLSSGLRINKAGDDAAGLAISEKMRAQIKGLDQAGRNSQDAISLIQTAEGALTETHSILQRMRELGVQAANDTLGSDDRSAISTEVTSLKTELLRISKTTQFNGKSLLDGSFGLSVNTTASTVMSVVSTISVDVAGAQTSAVYTIASTAAGVISLVDAAGNKVVLTGVTANFTGSMDFSSLGVKIQVNNLASTTAYDTLVVKAGSTAAANFKIGSNGVNAQENLSLSISNMSDTALGVNSVLVDSNANSLAAVDSIDNAIKLVNTERAKLGANQNRLEHTIANLGASQENLTASESRIRDVDMAKEMMDFTKNNILSQAATAMLAQANQQPQGVLQLLR